MRMMKRAAPIALALCVLCAGQAGALDYTIDAPEDYLFARPTSVEIIYRETEPVNTDRSKNVSLIPPGFGTPTSYLPGSGEYLTPNLVPGALSGGLTGYFSADMNNAITIGTGTYSGTAGYAVTDSANPPSPVLSDSTENGVNYNADNTVQYPGVDNYFRSDNTGGNDNYGGISYTDVTDDLYYSGGHLGTLKIPSVGVNVKIYEGTNNTQLAKGTGHFTDTSIWNGNVCLAAHNRGTNNYFGQIHTLNIGDKITLTTKLGTRTYHVVSVKKITETDNSDTAETWENCVTLFTCVRDERDYRWCVRAVETDA